MTLGALVLKFSDQYLYLVVILFFLFFPHDISSQVEDNYAAFKGVFSARPLKRVYLIRLHVLLCLRKAIQPHRDTHVKEFVLAGGAASLCKSPNSKAEVKTPSGNDGCFCQTRWSEYLAE